jgi:hypothetical protein
MDESEDVISVNAKAVTCSTISVPVEIHSIQEYFLQVFEGI